MADVPPERITRIGPPLEPEKNTDKTLDGEHSCGARFVLDLTCPRCHEALDGTSLVELLAYSTAALQERVAELERGRGRVSAP